METPKKNSARGTYRTLRQCLTDEEYLNALNRMEQVQKNFLKMLRDDIEPADWEDISI